MFITVFTCHYHISAFPVMIKAWASDPIRYRDLIEFQFLCGDL